MPTHRTGRLRQSLFSFVVLFLVTSAQAIWPFPPKRFTGNALIDAGSMGLDGSGRVIAFGDFNGDQLSVIPVFLASPCYDLVSSSLDVLSLADDEQTLAVYHWSHGEIIRLWKLRH